MTTTKDGQLFGPSQSQIYNNNQFSNLNLNQSFKFSNALSVQIKSKSNNDNYFGYTAIDKYQEKAQLWNKSTKNSSLKRSKNLGFNDFTDEKRRWKNDRMISSNDNSSSSTLSLHIAAYENSVEVISNDGIQDLSKKSKAFKVVHFGLNAQKDPFEFPRQMDGNKPAAAPEVQQFTAAQKLLTPNQEPKPAANNPPPGNRPLCLTTGEKLHNRFIVENLIGQGSFGQIFAGIDTAKNNRKVAIKVEPKFINSVPAAGATADPNGNDPRRLIIEKNVLIELRGKRHIPLLFASGKAPSNENPFFVMEFLGENLTTLRKQKSQQKFTQNTSFRIAQQITLALENLHQIGYIHRDIKPSNCCIGIENKKRVYLVDFGMCRKWRLDDGKTRSPRDKAPFRGTIRYASSRALSQQECGPSDDLIGWLYSVIELYQGHLPWAKSPNPQEVIRQKAEMPITELCASMPPTFLECFEYANHLGLTDVPDYSKVQKCLRDCLSDNYNVNDPFDWET